MSYHITAVEFDRCKRRAHRAARRRRTRLVPEKDPIPVNAVDNVDREAVRAWLKRIVYAGPGRG